jgi:hypothetical protein
VAADWAKHNPAINITLNTVEQSWFFFGMILMTSIGKIPPSIGIEPQFDRWLLRDSFFR